MEKLDRNTLFILNEKLVPFIFNKYFADLRYMEQDLIQSGKLGLWKACLKYDEETGKFCPFACKYIKDEMGMCVRNEVRYKNLCEEDMDGEFDIFENIGECDDYDTDLQVSKILKDSKCGKEFAQILKGKTIKSIAEEEGKSYHSLCVKISKEKERIKELYARRTNRL